MAIAVHGGHIARAIDFYKTPGKYFIIGGTKPWIDETNPPAPTISDFRLTDVIGLKRVDNAHLVVPDPNGTIMYRNQNWRIVQEKVQTTVGAAGIPAGSTIVPVDDVAGLIVGAKIRVNNLYDGTIVSTSGLLLTLDTPAPEDIPANSSVLGGAYVDGAKYVYVDCYLNYDEFPIMTYRQIGLCSYVTPDTENILLSSIVSGVTEDQYDSLGILEIIDNRAPIPRDINQREMLSLIVEF